jgi:nitrogen fixation NifU-like protein
LLDHFENPRNVGELSEPAVTVEVANPVCGDILRLSALWTGGRIAAARFKARGCTACVAMGSVLTKLIEGRDPAELQALRRDDLDLALGGLINESKHVAVLGMDAVKALLAAQPPSEPSGSRTARASF